MPRFTDPRYFNKRPWLEYVFIVSACAGQFLVQSATMDVLSIMVQLQKSFNSESSFRPWYMASFGLATGTMILISGRYGDTFGIKRVVLGGYLWTILWSLLCGFAWYTRHLGPDFFVAARAFQGAGLAFVLPNLLGAVGRVFSPGSLRKKVVFGCVGLCAPLGGWGGPFMAGVIGVTTERWDWNFYAYAITASLICVMTMVSMPDLPPLPAPDGSKQDLDLIGSVFGVGFLVLFNFVWNQAPISGWDAPFIIALLVVSFALAVAFVLWELFAAKQPLVPRLVLTNTRLLGILFIIFIGWGSFGIDIYHCFTLVLDFRHYSPLGAGAVTSPAPAVGAFAGISCALLISPKTVEYILLFAMMAFLSMSLILATAPIDQTYWRHTFGMWMIGPMGMDWSFPAATIMLSEELPPEYQGMAGSLVTVMVNYGTSIFLGFAGTIEEQLLKQQPDDAWRAWRASEYFAVGVAGLAVSLAIVFCILKWRNSPPPGIETSSEEKDSDTVSDISHNPRTSKE